ncbi:TPA: hypothetical protein DIV48_00545 [Candidatus Kaiserbacteria bacterium]|nr:MAG: TatC protein secretion pathway component [Parcubacteria group bacterium GW2011_GWA1_56_13]KKW45685.1 MAG: TatC protein secretion pathway component [Parcubacteria group bacterium GW2011_GWB1_57_6]HCR52120.1 hypothetical protein [Candidatus Kaiserbacteria bacterium]
MHSVTILGELKLFAQSIVYWVFAFVASSLFYFLVGPSTVTVFGKNIPIPVFTGDSFAVHFFKMMQSDFVPSEVTLIVMTPLSGFITQVEIALVLAFITVSPYFLYRFMQYLSPALFAHERKGVSQALVLSSALFIAGCVFAYVYLIPLTFELMYPFTTALGVTPLFSLDAFMAWIVGIMLATGVIFLLPIFMALLSFLGVVAPDFWRRKRRHALVSLLVFSAVITPDQTGITMVLLFVPLVLLYITGTFLARRAARS